MKLISRPRRRTSFVSWSSALRQDVRLDDDGREALARLVTPGFDLLAGGVTKRSGFHPSLNERAVVGCYRNGDVQQIQIRIDEHQPTSLRVRS